MYLRSCLPIVSLPFVPLKVVFDVAVEPHKVHRLLLEALMKACFLLHDAVKHFGFTSFTKLRKILTFPAINRRVNNYKSTYENNLGRGTHSPR